MLGTGNAVVTECYNTCFVLSENNNYFLVDGGGAEDKSHVIKLLEENMDHFLQEMQIS